jgi:hypothetical protein
MLELYMVYNLTYSKNPCPYGESSNYRSATENMFREVKKWTARVFLVNTFGGCSSFILFVYYSLPHFPQHYLIFVVLWVRVHKTDDGVLDC